MSPDSLVRNNQHFRQNHDVLSHAAALEKNAQEDFYAGLELEAFSRRERVAAGDECEPAAEILSRQAKDLHQQGFGGADGGHCRTRTCDLVRVKHAL